MNWLSRIPRVVIALAMILPLVELDSSWQVAQSNSLPRYSQSFLALVYFVALFVPGAIQRWKWRQMLVMALLGAATFGVLTFISSVFVGGPILWFFWYPAIVFVVLGISESSLTARGSPRFQIWTAVACLGASFAWEAIQLLVQMRGTRTFIPLLTGYILQFPLAQLMRFPLFALLGWLAIPAGEAASRDGRRFIRPIIGTGAIAACFLYAWFFGVAIYPLAERSAAGAGPLSRNAAADLLERRGLISDYELLWQQICQGTEDGDPCSANFSWQHKYQAILCRHVPDLVASWAADRLLQQPTPALANQWAEVLGQNRHFETVPILMRFALRGERECTRSLEAMGIPQAAMGWIMVAELNYGSGVVRDMEVHEKLVKLLGPDVGLKLRDWFALYDRQIDQLPSPLSPDLTKEVDEIVDCERELRKLTSRARDANNQLRINFIRLKMADADLSEEMRSLEKLFSGDEDNIQPQDGLYPAYLRLREFYAEAQQKFEVSPINWDVPTTEQWKAEIDAYRKRVEAAEEAANPSPNSA